MYSERRRRISRILPYGGGFSFLSSSPSAEATGISGYIIDGEDAGIEGVNVNLDGPYLTLPFTYNMSDVSPSSGAVAGQLSDWTLLNASRTDGSITTSVADSNSYTPAGVTKGFNIDWDAGRDGVIYDLPNSVAPIAGLRAAFLVNSAQANRMINNGMFNLTGAEVFAGGSITGKYATAIAGTPSPDEISCYSRYDSATERSEWSAAAIAGIDHPTNRYHWYRFEYNHTSGEITASSVRAEDSSLIFTKTVAMHADGLALSTIPSGMKSVYLLANDETSSCTVVKFWIGTVDDAWPEA